MNEYQVIKGSDIKPPPRERPRIIRPSKNFLWKHYFLTALTFIVFTIPLMVTFWVIIQFFSSSFPERIDLLMGAFYLIGFLYLVCWLVGGTAYVFGVTVYIRTMEFIVHGHEIVVRKGIINKSEKHVPYRTVTNIDMIVGPIDRMFRIGSIEIQTASGSGSVLEPAEEKLEGIKVYKEVRDYIIAKLRSFQSSQGVFPDGMGTEPVQERVQIVTPVEGDTTHEMVTQLKEIKELLAERLENLEKKIDELLDKKR